MGIAIKRILTFGTSMAIALVLMSAVSHAQERADERRAVRGEEHDMQKTMRDVLSSLFDKDYSGMLASMASNDEDRIKENARRTFASLDGLVDSINREWRSRYNEDFKDGLAEASIPYSFQQEQQKNASLIVPAGTGFIPVSLHLVDEGRLISSWRVDIPDSVSQQQIKDSLQTALQEIDNQKASWPSDKRTAYSAVAQKIFAALANNQPALRQAVNEGASGQYRGQIGGAGQQSPEQQPQQQQQQHQQQMNQMVPPAGSMMNSRDPVSGSEGAPASNNPGQDMGRTR